MYSKYTTCANALQDPENEDLNVTVRGQLLSKTSALTMGEVIHARVVSIVHVVVFEYDSMHGSA